MGGARLWTEVETSSRAFTKNEGKTSSYQYQTGPSAGVFGSGSYLSGRPLHARLRRLYVLRHWYGRQHRGLPRYHMYGSTMGEFRVTKATGEVV